MMTVPQTDGARTTPSDLRRTRRDLVNYATTLRGADWHVDIRIINISPRGLMCRCDYDLERGARVTIALPRMRFVDAEVRWAEDGRIGVEFLSHISDADYLPMLDLLPRKTNGW